MDEAEQLCDRLVVMDGGAIVAEGSPRELIETHASREVVELRFPLDMQEDVAGQMNGLAKRIEVLPDRVLIYPDDAERTSSELHDRGIEPLSMLIRRSTLEDVFLGLTGRTLVD
jgi:lipooligosaccharide transport system ATP-binding protein